mmetsp:Transcript_6746/g.14724  ORF Transcript_6746/g.14724 Transcript_6746/m.14724 type:complete len:221 (+) Transcript_6746:475-1137(+)
MCTSACSRRSSLSCSLNLARMRVCVMASCNSSIGTMRCSTRWCTPIARPRRPSPPRLRPSCSRPRVGSRRPGCSPTCRGCRRRSTPSVTARSWRASMASRAAPPPTCAARRRASAPRRAPSASRPSSSRPQPWLCAGRVRAPADGGRAFRLSREASSPDEMCAWGRRLDSVSVWFMRSHVAAVDCARWWHWIWIWFCSCLRLVFVYGCASVSAAFLRGSN